MNESTFKTNIRKELLRIGADPVRIEPVADAGIPDINTCIRGRETWIEAKLYEGGRVLLRPVQRAWMIRREMHGGNCMVFARHPSGTVHVWPSIMVARYVKHGDYISLMDPFHCNDLKTIIISLFTPA